MISTKLSQSNMRSGKNQPLSLSVQCRYNMLLYASLIKILNETAYSKIFILKNSVIEL